MALADLSGWLDDDSLDIPIPGHRTFHVPSPDATTGLRLSAIFNAGLAVNAGQDISESDVKSLQMDDGEEQDFLHMVLGPAMDEMVADGVSWTRIQRVGRYCFLYHAAGEAVANNYLEEATRPGGAPAPNRAARRASSGTAPKTQSRGSTGTTTRPRKPKAKQG